MRYIKDLLIEEVVLQVILSDEIEESKPLKVNEHVEEFIRRHIIKSLNSKDTYKAAFLKGSSLKEYCLQMTSSPSEFVSITTDMAKVYEECSRHLEETDCDLLFVKYIANEQRCFAVLKLDYKESYNHQYTGGEFKLILDNTLPGTQSNLSKCMFFTKGPEIELLVINKDDGEDSNYFVESFIEGVVIRDDVSKSRQVRKVFENWIRKNLCDQLEVASTSREIFEEYLQSESVFKLDDITEKLFEVEDIKENFKETMRNHRLHTDFEIDKIWIEKKTSKEIKTDTGLSIKAEFDIFKDSQRFITKTNGDGTMDYIIKGVRNVTEK